MGWWRSGLANARVFYFSDLLRVIGESSWVMGTPVAGEGLTLFSPFSPILWLFFMSCRNSLPLSSSLPRCGSDVNPGPCLRLHSHSIPLWMLTSILGCNSCPYRYELTAMLTIHVCRKMGIIDVTFVSVCLRTRIDPCNTSQPSDSRHFATICQCPPASED